MSVLLDTAALPAAQRAQALQESFRGESAQRVTSVGAGPVHHRIDLVELGPEVRLRRTVGSPLHVVRDERHVRREPSEHVSFGLQRAGTSLLSVGGSTGPTRAGHLHCVDTTRPYELRQRGTNERDDLVVADQQLGVSVDVVRAAAPALARSPVHDLVRDHLAGLFDATAQLAANPRLLAGQATVALLRTLLLTAAEHSAGRGALADSLEHRVRAYVDAHLGDPELSMEVVAAVHHVSVRHLCNAWARAGHERTLTRWITERRLERSREQLLAEGSASTSIAAVARRCGFSDPSHFSRRFRAAYGITPREWRAVRSGAAPRSRGGVVPTPLRPPP
ncbi:AraC family transcriptional regulator [Kineococcus sp. SYSU DK005]|uniref:AraC family transcriptional regulator n=1 Tax=Kineococcus sp. SYSU DK005 TaxID=3383126 RepID=UPI003D7CD72D